MFVDEVIAEQLFYSTLHLLSLEEETLCLPARHYKAENDDDLLAHSPRT